MSTSRSSRHTNSKKESNFRYTTRHQPLEKIKRGVQTKSNNLAKHCSQYCLLNSEGWKTTKQSTKQPVNKSKINKWGKMQTRNGKNKTNHEKVVIVSKRSSSVSVVKSCKLRKSVSVKKVSYSTSVLLTSEDEETDSDDESDGYEEEERKIKTKRKTVLKHTTSKIKSNLKNKSCSSKKSKALKLLCDKLTARNKSKEIENERELRPRFPYSNVLQEWPTARAHRMASLNALAKVHVLYENEGKTVGENLNEADETSLIDFLNENSEDDATDEEANSKLNVFKRSENYKFDALALDKKKVKKNKVIPKVFKRKRKQPDVEIIDTRICKRMANLNAQAMLAASYVQEPKLKKPPKKTYKIDSSSDTEDLILESKCDIKIIETNESMVTSAKNLEEMSPNLKAVKSSLSSENTDMPSITKVSSISEGINKSLSHRTFDISEPDIPSQYSDITIPRVASPKNVSFSNWSVESNISVSSNHPSPMPHDRSTPISTTAASEIEMTKYTEVRKLQINTCQDPNLKNTSEIDKNIPDKKDVAIMQMYHYQSNTTNESYCVQMQTTYKPAPKNLGSPYAGQEHMLHHNTEPARKFYGPPPLLPVSSYPIRSTISPLAPVMNIDCSLPHQYGKSAFTVPNYSQHIKFPHGYFQPAGPLIQPQQDQQTIHKPVPFHPHPRQPSLHQHNTNSMQANYDSNSSKTFSIQTNNDGNQLPKEQKQNKSSINKFTNKIANQFHHKKQSPLLKNTQSTTFSPHRNTKGLPSSSIDSSPLSKPVNFSKPENFLSYFKSGDGQSEDPNILGNKYSTNFSYSNHSPGDPNKVLKKYTFKNNIDLSNSQSSCSNSSVTPNSFDTSLSSNSYYSTQTNQNFNESAMSFSQFPKSTKLEQLKSAGAKLSHSKTIFENQIHNFNNKNSNHIKQPQRHLRAPVMPSLYSSRQGFREYQFENRPCISINSNEISQEHVQQKISPTESYRRSAWRLPELSTKERLYNSGFQQKVVDEHQHHQTSINTESFFKSYSDIRNAKTCFEKNDVDVPSSSSNYVLFENDSMQEIQPVGGECLMRPPSVIEIDEDSHQDAKTYIQLEVPKNSYQEKIVVIDVENDEININKNVFFKQKEEIAKNKNVFLKQKENFSKKNLKTLKDTCTESQNVISGQEDVIIVNVKNSELSKCNVNEVSVESNQLNSIITSKSIGSNIPIKTETSIPDEENCHQEQTFLSVNVKSENETNNNKTHLSEIVLDEKMKKKSALVRRALLHGKQRTFRDSYNRPLAQLVKNKKIKYSSMSLKNQPILSIPRLIPKQEKKSSHGWTWEGPPREKLIHISNNDPPILRNCYSSMRHIEGDTICVRDCVLLRSGSRKNKQPFVAKVTALWDNPSDGEMFMSLLWYYRPEHTECCRKVYHPDEIFASEHRDSNSVACIEDKCYILTYYEYCRYKKRIRMRNGGFSDASILVPDGIVYQREKRLPLFNVSQELILFCKRIYDYQKKKLYKNVL